MYVGRNVPSSRITWREWAESFRIRQVCPSLLVLSIGYSEAYEKHKQKEWECPRELGGAAVENTRGLTAHAPNRRARGGKHQVSSKDFREITRCRRFNRHHCTGNRATCDAGKVSLWGPTPLQALMAK